jgi:hypothetical protein
MADDKYCCKACGRSLYVSDSDSDSECPEDELIDVNIFTYTDGIEYLRGVENGYIYELIGDQDVVGYWDEETETIIFYEDEEIILKPKI